MVYITHALGADITLEKNQNIITFHVKVYFQGGMSEAEYRTMFALWALVKVGFHLLPSVASICLTSSNSPLLRLTLEYNM